MSNSPKARLWWSMELNKWLVVADNGLVVLCSNYASAKAELQLIHSPNIVINTP